MDFKEYFLNIKYISRNLFLLLDDIDILVPDEGCDITQLQVKRSLRRKLLENVNNVLKLTEEFASYKE